MNKWDRRGIDLARLVASWSKDPSTKVGAAIFRPDRTVASVGYNGLPMGVGDWPERLHDREYKRSITRHAEENAIAFAREPLSGCTLYVTPLHPCPRCAGAIIQAGLSRVVYERAVDAPEWEDSTSISMLEEAGVQVIPVEDLLKGGDDERQASRP